MAESPEEKEALAKLDETTREVAWEEEDKEADREISTGLNPKKYGVPLPGPLGWMGRFRPFRWKKGDPVPEPVDDEDPGDERGLRDALRDDPKQ
jgi:hypothetical protein